MAQTLAGCEQVDGVVEGFVAVVAVFVIVETLIGGTVDEGTEGWTEAAA